MGTNITGYIEINTVKESDEDIWFETIKLDVLAERNYEIFGNLFGVRAISGINVLAASRGIPFNTSNPNIFNCKSNSLVAHTWANWQELKLAKNIVHENPESTGWNIIFESMELLSKKFGAENVRMVVAFDNYG